MSNKTLLCALLFLLLFSSLIAQQAEGILIKNNGDTVSTTFVIPIFHGDIMNPLVFQNHPQIIINDNKFDVDISQYSEAQFEFGGKSFVFRSFSQVKDGNCFYKMKHLVQGGDVQLYRNYFPPAFSTTAVKSDYFVLDDEDRSILLRPMTFKKKLMKLFGSCPRFADLLRRRKFKYNQLEEIVAEYDACCQ